jgi:hypothetical protein
VKRLFSLLFGVAIIVAVMTEPCHATPITFSDDFNDGNADGWIFTSRDPRAGDPASSWSVVDGRLLNNAVWDTMWDTMFALVEDLSLAG